MFFVVSVGLLVSLLACLFLWRKGYSPCESFWICCTVFIGVEFLLVGLIACVTGRSGDAIRDVTPEELINATISPAQGSFYTACNRFRATTNNTERFVAAGALVPVLKEYVLRKPDEWYKSDLTFTNIVYLLGQVHP